MVKWRLRKFFGNLGTFYFKGSMFCFFSLLFPHFFSLVSVGTVQWSSNNICVTVKIESTLSIVQFNDSTIINIIEPILHRQYLCLRAVTTNSLCAHTKSFKLPRTKRSLSKFIEHVICTIYGKNAWRFAYGMEYGREIEKKNTFSKLKTKCNSNNNNKRKKNPNNNLYTKNRKKCPIIP